MYEPKTIAQAIKPVLAMNFIFGMGLFEFWRNKPHKILEYLYTISYILALHISNKYSTSYFAEYLVTSTYELSRTMAKMMFYSNTVVTSVLIITSRLNAKKMTTVITLLDTCDQTMENLGMLKQYRKLFLNQIMYFVFGAIPNLSFAIAIYTWQFKPESPVFVKLVLTILTYAPLTLISVCDISFCFWVRYLETKFKQLNEFLRSMLNTTSDSPQHKRILSTMYDFENKTFRSFRNEQVRGGNGNAKTMRAVKQLHLELIKIARTMNSTYGVQILLLMCISFIFTTGLLYVSYKLMWLNFASNEFIHQIMTAICCIIAYSPKIFYMNHVCAKTSAEAANAGDIICELYEPSTSREFRAEIRDFTLQLIQNPLVFTACGFFEMDHAFIQGVVGSITTYLVILIQVGDMTKVHYTNSTLNGTEN